MCIVVNVAKTKIRKIFINEILYIKAEGSYSIIKLNNDSSILVSKIRKNFNFLTENFNFHRINRSFIVNIDKLCEKKVISLAQNSTTTN